MESSIFLDQLVKIAEQAKPAAVLEGDYIGEDGLIYCGNCHTKKQHRLSFQGREMTVPVVCKCEAEKRAAEEEKQRKEEELRRIRQTKTTCIHDRALLQCTFEADDGSLPQLASARRYVETWEKRKAENIGLLLWGPVGTGKSFYAGCIANALIDRRVPVLMTNFPKILNKLSGMFSEDRNVFIADMMRYSLLIIDDFGIERGSEYALEQVYNVIDERYKTKLPLIITTNLSLDTLKNPPDIAHQRIYDRILSMCVPVKFSGASRRNKEKEQKYRSCRELFE